MPGHPNLHHAPDGQGEWATKRRCSILNSYFHPPTLGVLMVICVWAPPGLGGSKLPKLPENSKTVGNSPDCVPSVPNGVILNMAWSPQPAPPPPRHTHLSCPSGRVSVGPPPAARCGCGGAAGTTRRGCTGRGWLGRCGVPVDRLRPAACVLGGEFHHLPCSCGTWRV